jgi:leader peptidase (prepilin peptidase) / N-methyltransferase
VPYLADIYGYTLMHPRAAYAVVLFPFGACVGSFLNVVICRFPRHISLLSPPSSCPRCGRRISGVDNVPILSWILLLGRCRQCRTRISWRYPAVELLVGVLWAAVGWRHGEDDFGTYENIVLLMAHLLFVSSLVTASFIDLDYQYIPDQISIPGLATTLVLAYCLRPLHPEFQAMLPLLDPELAGLLGAFAGIFAGGGLLLILFLTGTLVFRRQILRAQEFHPEVTTVLGFGDVKLMAFAGAMVGWRVAFVGFFLGCILGAGMGVAEKAWSGQPIYRHSVGLRIGWGRRILHRWRTGVSVLPFGPFLCLGVLFLFFFEKAFFSYFENVFTPIRRLVGGVFLTY